MERVRIRSEGICTILRVQTKHEVDEQSCWTYNGNSGDKTNGELVFPAPLSARAAVPKMASIGVHGDYNQIYVVNSDMRPGPGGIGQ